MNRAGKLVLAVALAVACDPIEGRSLSTAPRNACGPHPCELYAPGPRTKVVCSGASQQCEIQGRPDYPFTIAVSVPSGSFYAPGHTFLVASADLYATNTTMRGQCKPPTCLSLPGLWETMGRYTARREAAEAVGYPLAALHVSVPVRVTFIPLLAPGVASRAAGLPGDVMFASSARFDDGDVAYDTSLPTGRYLRLSYPQAPFDAYFPPAIGEISVTGRSSDDVTLGARPATDPEGTRQLDDPSGDARRARVRRAEGLDGFRIWLADSASGRRISVVRTLSGVDAETRLDTTGQSAGSATALRDGVDVVVSPPDGWIGTPRLQSTLVGGQGLRELVYPPLPPPTSLRGVVATRSASGLTGISARLTLTSQTVLLEDRTPSPLLRYTTTLSTDESGRFSTVLPPGLYDAVVEPAEGTGFGKVKRTIDVDGSLAPTLEPPVRTPAAGRVVLSDDRPLASAQILALPSAEQPDPAVAPRAARARTAHDGSFHLELDPGSHELNVIPEPGTGFPRVVTIRGIGATLEDIGTIVVPAPIRVPLTIRAPSSSEAPGSPIARAIVRVFAETAPVGALGGRWVEIGSALTDQEGKCEILLAAQPR